MQVICKFLYSILTVIYVKSMNLCDYVVKLLSQISFEFVDIKIIKIHAINEKIYSIKTKAY
jgi:hypothetical protein